MNNIIKYSPIEAANKMLELVSFVKRLHDCDTLHLQINPMLLKSDDYTFAEGIKDKINLFSSPEVIIGDHLKIGKASDVYSLCAVFRSLIFGRPMTADEIHRPVVRLKNEEALIREAEISPAAQDIALTMLARGLRLSPENRIQTIDTFSEYITQLLNADAMQYCLVGICGYFKGCRINLRNSINIGRNGVNEVRFPSDTPYVSRIHCNIIIFDGKLLITDKKSRFGTFLNEKKLAPETPVTLKLGDKLYIGSPAQAFYCEKISEA